MFNSAMAAQIHMAKTAVTQASGGLPIKYLPTEISLFFRNMYCSLPDNIQLEVSVRFNSLTETESNMGGYADL